MLEQENAQLRLELDELAKLRVQLEELEKLRAENVTLREAQRGENEGAFMKRLQEERLELVDEVKELRARLADQEQAITRLKRNIRLQPTEGVWADLIDRLFK